MTDVMVRCNLTFNMTVTCVVTLNPKNNKTSHATKHGRQFVYTVFKTVKSKLS